VIKRATAARQEWSAAGPWSAWDRRCFAAGRSAAPQVAATARYVTFVVAAFALAFLYVGVQSIRGKARDIRGYSIGSFVFGAL